MLPGQKKALQRVSLISMPRIGGIMREIKKIKFPAVGLRIIKSSIVVFICLFSGMFRPNGIPFYSAIAAVLCIQPYREEGKRAGLGRIWGTFIGAFWGSLVLFINLYLIPGVHPVWQQLVISLTIIPVIYTTVLFKKPGSVFIACVVMLSISVNHITDSQPFLFVINRILDTWIGVFVAFIADSISLPKNRNKDLLIAAHLEDVMLDETRQIPAYTRIHINRMIDSGAKFTLISHDTPAALLEYTRGLRIKLPVIALDGAVLYQPQNNCFLKSFVIPYSTAIKMIEFLKERNLHCFATTIVDNTVLTYIGEFHNPVEEKLYQKYQASPYFNYLHKQLPAERPVVFLMVVETDERITELKKQLEQQEFAPLIRVACYPSGESEGYSYMKIYNCQASPEHMVHYLKQNMGIKEKVILDSASSYHIDGPVRAIKVMKKLYEPYIWNSKAKDGEAWL